jgi:hypothetical protein
MRKANVSKISESSSSNKNFSKPSPTKDLFFTNFFTSYGFFLRLNRRFSSNRLVIFIKLFQYKFGCNFIVQKDMISIVWLRWCQKIFYMLGCTCYYFWLLFLLFGFLFFLCLPLSDLFLKFRPIFCFGCPLSGIACVKKNQIQSIA